MVLVQMYRNIYIWLMQSSTEYYIIGLAIVSPVLVKNKFPSNWFNAGFYCFDHKSSSKNSEATVFVGRITSSNMME